MAAVAIAATGAAGCDEEIKPRSLTSGGEIIFSDTGAERVARAWGGVDCEGGRILRIGHGGDEHETAAGDPQGDSSYRRLEVSDAQPFEERCELGENDHRTGPTAVFGEGERLATFASLRLPPAFPLAAREWQVVLQMKQTQPAENADGTPVLALEARRGRWRLMQSASSGSSDRTRRLWSAPARAGAWTRFAFEVVYSQDPAKGSVKLYVDLNGDGDAADAGEHSGSKSTYTLKRELADEAPDGIEPGASIPSHLRVGLYHDRDIDCPPDRSCAVEVDNVQIVRLDPAAPRAG